MDCVKFKTYFDPELQCYVNAISIDRDGRAVKIQIEDGNHVDMGGAIRVAEGVWPQVKFVVTGYRDGGLDMVYVRADDGAWVARNCEGWIDGMGAA